MMYDLVATDFDMTLKPPAGEIGPRTMGAIARIRDLGVHFTVVSGRTTAGLIHNLTSQGFDLEEMYVISYNGAAVAEASTGRQLVSRTIGRDVAAAILGHARAFQVEMIVPEGEYVYTEWAEPIVAGYEARSNATTLQQVPDLALLGIEPHKILIGGEADLLRTAAAEIAAPFRDVAEFSFSAPFMLEVTAKNVDKGTAFADMCAALGIDRSRTIAFGDNHNDIPMIRQAGLGVAVANAVPELKEVADRVTAACDEEGLADVLDELFPVRAPGPHV